MSKKKSKESIEPVVAEKVKEPYFTPKYKKKKVRLMTCTHPECENVFMAYPHARFCEVHKDASTRKKEAKVEEKTMFIFNHNFKEKTRIERACDLCGKPYELEVYPGREDYPRFCDDHHSEYKRFNWRETHGKKEK